MVYGLGFGTACISQVSLVQGKLLTHYSKRGGVLGPAQSIVLKAMLQNTARIKNLTEAEIEAVFQSSIHTVDATVQWALNAQ